MLAHEAVVSPGDLVRFWRLEHKPRGCVVPTEFWTCSIQELRQFRSNILGKLIDISDFAVVLEAAAAEWSTAFKEGVKYKNNEWKLLHPEHGVVLVHGVCGWNCEVIKCFDQ